MAVRAVIFDWGGTLYTGWIDSVNSGSQCARGTIRSRAAAIAARSARRDGVVARR